MFEFKGRFLDVSVQRMTNNLQTGSRETFQASFSSVERDRQTDRQTERMRERTLRRHVVTVSI